MNEFELYLKINNGEFEVGDEFESIQENYDYNVHGSYYRHYIKIHESYIQRDIYNSDGELKLRDWLTIPKERKFTMKKEEIQLVDFVAEFVKTYDLDPDEYAPTAFTAYKCSECGKSYSGDDKFCSIDGKPIIEYQYKMLTEEAKNSIMRMFYDFENSCDDDEKFPYKYIDGVEKRGDGSGYYMNFIFMRKSDGKYFYYTSYDGRVENDTLRETSKEVRTVWDFEENFD